MEHVCDTTVTDTVTESEKDSFVLVADAENEAENEPETDDVCMFDPVSVSRVRLPVREYEERECA